jgi:acyl carrier protein
MSNPATVAELVGLLGEVTGEDDAWVASLGADSRLDALLIDSFELAALDDLVRLRHGDAVDLVGYVYALTLDEIIALTVGDLAERVARRSAALPAEAEHP